MQENENNTPQSPVVLGFQNPMTRGETVAALVYLVFHVAIIPLLLDRLIAYWPDGKISLVDSNLVYYAIGLIFMAVFLGRFYRRCFDRLADHVGVTLLVLLASFALYYILSIAVQFGVSALLPEMSQSPNDETILAMATESYGKTLAMSVILAPLVEEPLFRGAVFGSLYKRGRVVAYVGSVLLFALLHVWQYAWTGEDSAVLLYTLLYIPASVALAYSYEKTSSIWTPVFFHMILNALSMYVMARM